MRFIQNTLTKNCVYLIYSKEYQELIISRYTGDNANEEFEVLYSLMAYSTDNYNITHNFTDHTHVPVFKNDILWKLTNDEILKHVIMEHI